MAAALTRVYLTAPTLIPNGVWTPLAFGAERFDDDGMWGVPNFDRLVCKVAGVHIMCGTIGMSAGGSIPAGGIRLNGTTFISTDGFTTTNQGETASMWKLAVGDYVQLMAYQNSGSNATATIAGDIAGEFSVCRVA